MGNACSAEVKVYKAAKRNDVDALKVREGGTFLVDEVAASRSNAAPRTASLWWLSAARD